ncbi:glycosyltransferase family 2 protein [Candidatus Woesearchaeota archaeon]|nr:glycosyltransferase family 2 protein [Candidatus Woesearchaeota archaeon]
MKLPTISFIIPTYNDKVLVKRCLDSILSQKYPKNKIEIITIDGGSTDGTLELLKKYPVKLLHNKKRFPEGKGMGKDQAVQKAKNELIAFVDQDNEVQGVSWLLNMVEPLTKDKEIFGVACKLKVKKEDNITNRYLSLVGTDPFAVYRSIEGRMALNKIKLKDEEKYYTYKIKTENCLCTGGNCFIVRKKLLDDIGGYTQDVEMIYRLAEKEKNKLAIPKHAYTHHATVTSFSQFLRKRHYWAAHQRSKNIENRNYSWEPRTFNEYRIFILFLIKSLTILPNFIVSVNNYLKTKEKAWLLHAPSVFLITLIYGKVWIQDKFRKLI